VVPRSVFVVIMAGGSGTRFWPASRRARPKQFLSIGGSRSLLRQTAERVLGEVGPEQVLVVTGADHAEHAWSELPELPRGNILVEPVGRNTAPCIGWATRAILARDSDAAVAVLPADHFIADVPGFVRQLNLAIAHAGDYRTIVLLGLVPTAPETGYGYIRRGASVGDQVYAVARFVEKPDRKTAEGYLAEGGYLWNSGMFVFSASAMDRAIREHLPELATGLDALGADPTRLSELYPALPSISIDYGVMERARDVRVLPANFPWSDVGSWDAAKEVFPADALGNVVRGDALLVDSRGSLVDAQGGRFVALVGVHDLIVVDTKDALLVVPRGRSQEVKKVVDHLQEKDRKELL
jgi:mannose-1-phosphate guanylyltransferase